MACGDDCKSRFSNASNQGLASHGLKQASQQLFQQTSLIGCPNWEMLDYPSGGAQQPHYGVQLE